MRSNGIVKVLCVAMAGLALAMAGYAQREGSQPAAPATLTIDASKTVAKVSPTLYGLMTEEINYSYEGGIYGELVQNRTFRPAWDDVTWLVTPHGTARGSTTLDKTTGPSAALPTSLKVTVTQADTANPLGLRNEGWWGIAVRPNETFHGSLYAKADAAGAEIKVSLIANDTGHVIATAEEPAIGTEWKQYTFTLHAGEVAASSRNQLMVEFERPGTVWLQQVSLFPPTYHDRANGNRSDIMELLAAMHPAFLRLPGGNYLEGDHINERFNWKKTIGPLVDRPGHPSPWRYWSTDGFGLLEYLEWCEDLHMQPVLAVYAGYSLQQEFVAPGPALEPYVQDAVDEIEYVTGDVSTKWGAERAKDGHPAPFPLTYVEIGNEDFFDHSNSYDGRFAQFYDAIKKKYPALQVIATTPVKSRKPDVLDEHYYRRAEEFFADVHHYDATDRNGPKIFVGEWATREGTPTTNFGAALGDAAWMTGMERNSDVIVMASYAPLFVNVNPGGMQWRSDLMGYDALSSYGSPSYYAQAMFANHIGTEVVASELKGAGDRFFYSVTRDAATGVLYLKLVNASSSAQQLKISLAGVKDVKSNVKLITLSATTTAETNSISDPRRVLPVESTVKIMGKEFERTVPGYSIEVLEISAQ
jgi:alpha-N-arabinofuranosidase